MAVSTGQEGGWVDLVVNNLDEGAHPFHLVCFRLACEVTIELTDHSMVIISTLWLCTNRPPVLRDGAHTTLGPPAILKVEKTHTI